MPSNFDKYFDKQMGTKLWKQEGGIRREIVRGSFCVDIRCPNSLKPKDTDLALKFLVCPKLFGR